MLKRLLVGIILVGIPWIAAAQLIDFDAECPSPPCAVGTLYAPWGIAFTPNTTPIVAYPDPFLGLHRRYLAITTFPYQLTITLARPATFFSMQVSRLGTSSGPVTVSVTRLKGGQPLGVSVATATLPNVNEWTSLSGQVSVGPDFDSLVVETSGGANQSIGIDKLQFGGLTSCFGFADLDPADIFCNATEWLANRGVTAGCATAQYCPSQNVTRAQMALFMQRLGNVLVPAAAIATGNIPAGPLTWASPVCIATIEPASYPRLAWVWSGSDFWTVPLATSQPVLAKILVSENGGDWVESPGITKHALAETGYRHVGDQSLVSLSVGVSYRLALGLSIPATVAMGECELMAQITSTTGVFAPH